MLKKSVKLVVVLPVLFLIIFFVFDQTYQIFGKWETSGGLDGLANTLTWSFGEVIGVGYYETDTLHTVTNLIEHHIIWPSEWYVWIFGDPSSWLALNKYTDMGYIRMLNACGLLGVSLFYGGYITLLYAITKRLPDKKQKTMILALACYLFIAEMKEPFLLKCAIPTFCFTMLFYFQKSRNNTLEEKTGKNYNSKMRYNFFNENPVRY